MRIKLSKTKKSIIVVIFVLVIIGISIIYIDSKNLDPSYNSFDRSSAKIIRDCITAYIADTNDYELKFGEKESVSDVNELFKKLTLEVTIEGKKYEPYLLEIHDRIRTPPSHILKNGYKGWKIVIDKRKEPMEAVSVVHYKFNIIEFIEN